MTPSSPGSPATAAADDFIVDLALERGVLQPAQVAAARALQAGPMAAPDASGTPARVLEVLQRQGVLTSRQVAELLAAEFGLPMAPDLANLRVGADVLELVPRAVASRHRVLPLAKENNRLRVAIADPLDTDGTDALGYLVKLPVDCVVATPEDIVAAIDRFYGKDASSIDDLLNKLAENEEDEAVAPEGEAAPAADATEADAPIIKLVYQLILEAIQRRASDIHVEPLEKRFRVRYRVDGVLIEVENPPKRLQMSILSRLKIMANISIAEKRIPQDGRIQIGVGGKQLDLRVSSLPTVHGESIVMRILDKEGLTLGLPELGFFSDDAATFERLIALPDGILLVTGPTGSGKTTTLYGCLHYINKPDRKIITVEDPVEYQLNGINQVPVRHDVGMTFAAALRAMLRQAPNVVARRGHDLCGGPAGDAPAGPECGHGG